MFLVLIFLVNHPFFLWSPSVFPAKQILILVPQLPADCTDEGPINRHFFNNNFTIIPILFSQLLKPGIIQVPWDLVSHSIAVKGFTASGTLCFGQKSKRSEKIMMLKTQPEGGEWEQETEKLWFCSNCNLLCISRNVTLLTGFCYLFVFTF